MILVTDDGGTQWLVNEYGWKIDLDHAASGTAWAAVVPHVATVDAADMDNFLDLADQLSDA